MFPGPVFFAEMRSSSRNVRSFIVRTVLGCLFLLICSIYLGGLDPKSLVAHQQRARIVEGLFTTFAFAQGFALAILTPALVAPAIAQERSRKTLDYLLASRLSSSEIVVGKLAARLTHVFVFLLVGLPIVSMLTTIGGIDPKNILIYYAISVSVVLVLGGISIFVSTVSPGPREAVFLSYGIAAFWLCLAPIMSGPFQTGFPDFALRFDWLISGLESTNPLTATLTDLNAVILLVASLSTAGLFFIVASVLSLRAYARKSQDYSIRVRSRFPQFRRRAVLDDAMRWKETQVRRARGLSGLMINLLVFLTLLALAVATIRDSREPLREVWEFGYGSEGRTWAAIPFNQFLRAYGSALYIVVLLVVTVSAACSITTEREGDTWTSIVASPLEAREILRGKRAGVYRRLRLLLICPMAMWTLGLVAGAIHPIGFVLTVVLYFVYITGAVSLGTIISLHCKSSTRALTISIAILLFLNVGYLFFCGLIAPSLLICAGSSSVVMYLAPMSYRDVMELAGQRQLNFTRTSIEFLVLAMFSFSFYSILATVVNLLAIQQFDRVEDRPSGRDSR